VSMQVICVAFIALNKSVHTLLHFGEISKIQTFVFNLADGLTMAPELS